MTRTAWPSLNVLFGRSRVDGLGAGSLLEEGVQSLCTGQTG